MHFVMEASELTNTKLIGVGDNRRRCQCLETCWEGENIKLWISDCRSWAVFDYEWTGRTFLKVRLRGECNGWRGERGGKGTEGRGREKLRDGNEREMRRKRRGSKLHVLKAGLDGGQKRQWRK